MDRTYLAFDFGASGGRAIAGRIHEGRIILEEIHRFANRMTFYDGSYFWDIYRLYDEMVFALNECHKKEITPASIAIDTWGVDFTFLDRKGNIMRLPYAYRDHRTDGIMQKLFQLIPAEKIYELTGVQFMQFNSLFQLYAAKKLNQIDETRLSHLLFMPDVLNYMLSGVRTTEFSFATTSQLFNPNTLAWEPSLFKVLGLSLDMMEEPVAPGTIHAELSKTLRKKINVPAVKIASVASHDTGSAIAAVPAIDNSFAYISSGTWSLMGIESEHPIINERSYQHSFTNEGGVDGTFRVLKNIMGLWLIQECKRIWMLEGKEYSYPELVDMAEKEIAFLFFMNPDDPGLLNPKNMVEVIQKLCRISGQKRPETPGQIARVIFESLAFKYRDTLERIREISSKKINRIHIIGGGSENQLLCQFTANATGLPVIAGPKEGTALGNLLVQAQAAGEVKDRYEIRRIITQSFEFKTYEPQDIAAWDTAFHRFKKHIKTKI